MRGIVHFAVSLLVLTVFLAVGSASVSADEKAVPSVEQGKKLFGDPSIGTNGKTCATCHPSEEKVGELAARSEWFGGKAKTLEQAINFCVKGPLEGKPLADDSVELKSIAMYMKSLIKE
jgi:mono/diheme cytochrome c family protein